MVTKVYIKDNTNAALKYIVDLDAFANGKEYIFKPGVNIIVGENGSGKTTLMELIKSYLLVGNSYCEKGIYNCNITHLCAGLDKDWVADKMTDGVDVYADYQKNTFRLCHVNEKTSDDAVHDFDAFGRFFLQKNSSTGESVTLALHELFGYMFSANAQLRFDYESEDLIDLCPAYVDYVKSHRVDCDDEYTILMDEPDRNLDINKIDEIKSILSFHKEGTQVIAVVHNPLLIYSLSKNKDIHFIELTEGYIDTVCKAVDKIIKG